MQLTVIPASSRICQAAISELLNSTDPPKIIGIYRDPGKAPAEFKSNSNFTAVQGDATNASTLDFEGSDVVLALTPPKYDGTDTIEFSNLFSSNVAAELKRARIKKLVYISSGGAQYEEGVGEIKTSYVSEQHYLRTANEVVFLRNGYFMDNWARGFESLKGDKPFLATSITPPDHKIPMISTRDIGRIAAARVLDPLSLAGDGPEIFTAFGPEEYSSNDVKAALEAITGLQIDLKEYGPDQLQGYFAAILPENLVPSFVEMTKALLPGELLDRESKDPPNLIRGTDTLKDHFERMLK